jgi:hypothetical protein
MVEVPFFFQKHEPLKLRKNYRAPIVFHNFDFENTYLHVNLKFFCEVETDSVFNINLNSQFDKKAELLRNIYIVYANNNSFLKFKDNRYSFFADIFPLGKYENTIIKTRFDKYDDIVKDIFFDEHCLNLLLKMF